MRVEGADPDDVFELRDGVHDQPTTLNMIVRILAFADSTVDHTDKEIQIVEIVSV